MAARHLFTASLISKHRPTMSSSGVVINSHSCRYCYIDLDVDDHRSNLALVSRGLPFFFPSLPVSLAFLRRRHDVIIIPRRRHARRFVLPSFVPPSYLILHCHPHTSIYFLRPLPPLLPPHIIVTQSIDGIVRKCHEFPIWIIVKRFAQARWIGTIAFARYHVHGSR